MEEEEERLEKFLFTLVKEEDTQIIKTDKFLLSAENYIWVINGLFLLHCSRIYHNRNYLNM